MTFFIITRRRLFGNLDEITHWGNCGQDEGYVSHTSSMMRLVFVSHSFVGGMSAWACTTDGGNFLDGGARTSSMGSLFRFFGAGAAKAEPLDESP